MLDADNTLDWFFQSCSASSNCPFHEPTPEAVRERYERVMDNLKRVPVTFQLGDLYGVVDWDLARGVVFSSLYKPFVTFPLLAQALLDLEHGNAAPFYQLSGEDSSLFRCDAHSSPYEGPNAIWNEANLAIKCGDGDPVNDTLDELVD